MKSLAAKTLLDMAEAKNGRSMASRIRDLYPEIDKAIKAGVKREAIVEVLHNDGIAVTMKTFESVLYRIRLKEKKLEGKRSESTEKSLPIGVTIAIDQGTPHEAPRTAHRTAEALPETKPVEYQAVEPAPVDEPVLESPSPNIRKPMTPADFRKIRNEPIDTRRLSQPVKRPK